MSNEDEAGKKTTELEDAAACGKLWEIYATEAQKYDNGLIESWKADMDSVLIFSGLYSAILTAFVIESYQNLQPDPADGSALLLKRISQQLATPSNSSGLTPFPDDEPFAPTSSALACNILWFISLALALTCAFLATLVQQWSRRFLHRTSRAQSPGVHAHLLQYLYFGLKDLKMHTVVDLIPSLLHLSLFSFFAGLIGFLRDVNSVLTWLFVIALGIVLLIYFTFTLVPLVYLDSPYSTPLSPVLWQVWQVLGAISRTRAVRAVWDWFLRIKPQVLDPVRAVWDWLSQIIPQVLSEILRPLRIQAIRPIQAVWHRISQIKPQVLTLWDRLSRIRTSNDEEAQSESIAPDVQNQEPQQPSLVTLTLPVDVQTSRRTLIGASLEESKKRRPKNESRCIIWTLNSLNDDTELLPFLEALPHVLLRDDLDGLRGENFHLMNALVSKTDIVSRTLSLMENATNSWHQDKHRNRCAIAGAKTLYSLARVLVDQQFRGRFTHSDKCPSPFTGEMLKRISRVLFKTTESEPFYNSVVALCIFSVLQSLNDCIQADQRISHSQFQEAVTSLESHSPYGIKEYRYNFENEPSGEQAKPAIKEMISAAFCGYLFHTIDRPSFNLVHVSNQMIQDGSDFLQAEADPGNLFRFLRWNYPQRPSEHTDMERMDTIFCIGFERLISFTLAKGSENDRHSALEQMLLYIDTRFDVGGWGSTKELWSGSEQLLKLLDYLGKSEVSLNDVSDSALQELLLHAIHEDDDVVVPFLEHGLSHVHAQSKEENTPKSHLWFLLVLIILYKFCWSDDKERFSSILDQINGKLPVDPEWNDISPCPHIEDQGHLRVTVILYCLDSKLPANNTRDILQLFFYCFSYEYYDSLGKQPNLLNELVKHSEHFATEFLRTPSKESMDITALVWGLLWEVLFTSDSGIDNAREAWEAVRLGLKTLSNAADKLLSPDGRKAVEEEIKKSTPEQRHTILLEHQRNRIDLLNMVERVQKHLPVILEEIDRVHSPTTTSPSSSDTVNKETELAIDDHSTSQATDFPQVPNVTLTPATPFTAEVGVKSEPLLHWGCI